MTGFILSMLGWFFFFLGLASETPWDDRFNGVALGLFIGGLISFLTTEG